jgi:hypothetical protein
MSNRVHVVSGLAGEVAFAVLPLLAVLMVLLYTQHAHHIFASPEWTFGAAILFGQAVVKFVAGLARAGAAAPGPVALMVALLVVFGLVPSILVLTMTLHSAEIGQSPSRWLQTLQVVLFFSAAGMYMVFGTIGEEWGRRERTGLPSNEPGSPSLLQPTQRRVGG